MALTPAETITARTPQAAQSLRAEPRVERESFTELPQDDRAADFLQGARNRTRPARSRAGRPPLFNAPRQWYAHPTSGDIVSLPGDATNQAYYVAKGFYKLTPEEAWEWEHHVRPVVLAESQKRAQLVTTLRRIADRHPGVELAGDLAITPMDQLQEMLKQLQTMTGGTVAVVMGRFREELPMEQSLAEQGITVGGGDELEGLTARSRAAAGRQRRGGRFMPDE